MPTPRSIQPIAALLLIGGIALLGGLAPPMRPTAAAEPTPNQAGLVVRFGDGSTRTACVDLGADGQATGEEVLTSAGLSTVTSAEPGAGSVVCKIEEEGCTLAQGCFCQCTLEPGTLCTYWAYYHLGPSGWIGASGGATSAIVRGGAVEGWSWGPGGVGSGVAPPVIPFGEICAQQAPQTRRYLPIVIR